MSFIYKGKVALVTGASTGIGAKIVEELVKSGVTVVGAARRVDRIEELAKKLKDQPGKVVPRKLDVKNEQEILSTFKWIDSDLGGLSILVNNAGVIHPGAFQDLTTEGIRSSVEVNIIGTSICAREAVNSFIRRRVEDGYIININSTTGHQVPYFPNSSLGLYPATKFAITAMGETLRHSIRDANLKVRVTSVSPGATATDMTEDLRRAGYLDRYLQPEDVARAVGFALSLPVTAEITELTIRPTGEV